MRETLNMRICKEIMSEEDYAMFLEYCKDNPTDDEDDNHEGFEESYAQKMEAYGINRLRSVKYE